MSKSIPIEKGDHLKIESEHLPVKAIEDFDLLDALNKFNEEDSNAYIMERNINYLPQNASFFFRESFQKWLIDNGYVKLIKPKGLIEINWSESSVYGNTIDVDFGGAYEDRSREQIPMEVKVIDENISLIGHRSIEWRLK